MQIDALSEEVTVISDTPVIDLQSTSVGVNWDEKQMDDLPYGRGIRGLARLVPGLSPTQFDVGGNTVGGSTTTGARSYGRTGQELIKFDGVVWDQFFGDYNTYEQVQVSAAAKGAEAQSPGVTLSFVIKSGGNQFSGMYLRRMAGRRVPGRQRHARSCATQGFDPGNNKFTRYNDISLDLGGPIIRDKLWFYGAYGYNYSGLFIPGFISDGDRRAGRILHAPRQPDAEAHLSDEPEQQVRAVAAVQPQVAAVSQRQRVRAAGSHAEPDRVDGDRSGAEVDAHPEPEHDVRCELQPIGLLVAGLRVDRRRAANGPDDHADARRVPRAAARAGALGLQRHL